MVLAAAARENGQAGKIGHSGEESNGDREKEMEGDGEEIGRAKCSIYYIWYICQSSKSINS